MKRNVTLAIAAIGVVSAGLYLTRPTRENAPQTKSPFELAQSAFANGDHAKARASFQRFIETEGENPDKQVQNKVTRARMGLGYLAAREKKFDSARTIFIEADRQHRGTTRSTGDYGSLSDQAAYQAAVCLAATNDPKASDAFRELIRTRPLSPIVYAAHKRLARLNGGATKADDDALLQSALAKQEARAKVELAACGPKALAKLLREAGRPVPNLASLRSQCGTTNEGTTMAGIRKGLAANGLASVGLDLNRNDLGRLKLPALWLREDHYVVLLKITLNKAEIFDPLTEETRKVDLPGLGSSDFLATIVALEMPVLEEIS